MGSVDKKSFKINRFCAVGVTLCDVDADPHVSHKFIDFCLNLQPRAGSGENF